jgi:hypothetical protein
LSTGVLNMRVNACKYNHAKYGRDEDHKRTHNYSRSLVRFPNYHSAVLSGLVNVVKELAVNMETSDRSLSVVLVVAMNSSHRNLWTQKVFFAQKKFPQAIGKNRDKCVPI